MPGKSSSPSAVFSKLAAVAASTPSPSHLPRWRGFNLLDFFSPNPDNPRCRTTADHLRWIADWGFDFVRLPMAYPAYVRFDRSRPITPDEVVQFDSQAIDRIDALVGMAHDVGLHVSLNLHRAPGFCVNSGFHEPYNLWTDDTAQQAFCEHWSMWAKRYKGITRQRISFDLVNEPCHRDDMNDQHSRRTAVPGAVYRKLAIAAAAAIRAHNPDHLIVADGNDIGKEVVPELIDLDIAQSCRGYHPGAISHYKAPWANKDPDHMPQPVWPGQVGDQQLGPGMLEAYYQPWIDLKQQGVGVHCGECGCWNKTPHHVFLAWFEDLLKLLTRHSIGYSLWQFTGAFGILDSERTDIDYEPWHGHQLDRQLLTLLQKY